MLVHDGSYMEKVDPTICSAAFIMKCLDLGNIAEGSLIEKTEAADNYRAKALAAIVGGLSLIHAVTQCGLPYREDVKHIMVTNAFVKHGSEPSAKLPEQAKSSGCS